MLPPSQPGGKAGLSQTASMSDILTAVKGIVSALGGIIQDLTTMIANQVSMTTATNLVATNVANDTAVRQAFNGTSSLSGITSAVVVKGSPGRIVTVIVATAGSTIGGVYDATSTAGITPGTTTTGFIAELPMLIGPIALGFPANNGIVIVPGTGQVVSVVYS